MRKNTKTIFILSSLFCLGCITVSAQQNTVAMGGDASGAGGSASYSVGQIDYVDPVGAGGSISQGVQQPYQISVTGINNTDTQISLTAFPNPVIGQLSLKIDEPNVSELSYRIYTAEGKLLIESQISSTEEYIDFQSYAYGTYFVKVIKDNTQEIKTFKIIKTK